MKWAEHLAVPAGIGVDLVDAEEIRALDERTNGAFSAGTFTKRELEQAAASRDPVTWLAGRFAVKEAVFKAVAHRTLEKTFDFRCVETLRAEDGSPYIRRTPELDRILKAAGVGELFVSISNESGFAIAFVLASAVT